MTAGVKATERDKKKQIFMALNLATVSSSQKLMLATSAKVQYSLNIFVAFFGKATLSHFYFCDVKMSNLFSLKTWFCLSLVLFYLLYS